MICLHVKLVVKPGEERRVAGWFRKLQEASRKEPGCLLYVVHQHVEQARQFMVYEQYKDEKALDLHRNSAHFKDFAASKIYTVTERIERDLYKPIV